MGEDKSDSNSNSSNKKKVGSKSPFRMVGKAVGKVGSAAVGTVSNAAHQVVKPLSQGFDDNPPSTDDIDLEQPAETVSQLHGTNYGSTAAGSGSSDVGIDSSLMTAASDKGSTATTATRNTAKAVLGVPKTIVKTAAQGVTKTAEHTTNETTKLLGNLHGRVSGGASRHASKDSQVRGRESIVGGTPLYQDATLSSMDPIFTKFLEGVSVEEWAETCWLKDGEAADDGTGTVIPIDPSSTVFGSFLVATGNSNVVMSKWETSDAKGVDSFHGEWDNEAYSHRRIVTYDKPGGGFSSGSIQVKQTQDFRYQAIGAGDSDKEVAIVAFTVNVLAGIPYTDAFKVQVRWVATSLQVAGAPVIRLQVGCFVVFSKKVIVAGIIKSSTLTSSLDDQNNTLEAMKAACGAAEVDQPKLLGSAVEKETPDDAGPNINISAGKNPLVCCFLWIFNGLVWMIASVTSAVVTSVLDNKMVQQAGVRFVVCVVEQASQDPQLAQSLAKLVPSPPPMRPNAPEKQSLFKQLKAHPSTSQNSSNEFTTKEE